MDRGPPGSSVHGISQTRILEGVAIPSPGDLLNPGRNRLLHWQASSLSLEHLGSPLPGCLLPSPRPPNTKKPRTNALRMKQDALSREMAPGLIDRLGKSTFQAAGRRAGRRFCSCLLTLISPRPAGCWGNLKAPDDYPPRPAAVTPSHFSH